MKRKMPFYVLLVLLLVHFPMSVFALQTEFSGKDDLATDLNLYSYTTGTISINSGAKPTQSPVVTKDTWIEYEVPQNSLLEFEVKNADAKSNIQWLVQTSTNNTDWETIQTSISITSYDGSYWYVVKHSASLNNARYVKIHFPTVDVDWSNY